MLAGHSMAEFWKIRFKCLISTNEIDDQRGVKGLLIDLDGTILPEDNRPTDRVVEAIAAASKLIPVAIASGREQGDVSHFARLFGLSTPQVSDNGAALIDPVTGRAMNRYILDRSEAERVITELKKVSASVLACDAGRFVRNPDDIVDWQISIIMAKLESEAAAHEWVEEYSTDTLSLYATNDNSGDWYVDCTAGGIDKSVGAVDFAAAVGIDIADLMVIGDGWNDIPMFRVAGTGIAMEGAPADLLEHASGVTPNIDQDGAALAIEQYVLNR